MKKYKLEKSLNRNLKKLNYMLEKNNIPATVRISMGSDIGGACGQLRRKHK